MPTHEVDVSMPTRELGHSDVVFNVKVDDARLGTPRFAGSRRLVPLGKHVRLQGRLDNVRPTDGGQWRSERDPLTKRYLAGETVRIGLKSRNHCPVLGIGAYSGQSSLTGVANCSAPPGLCERFRRRCPRTGANEVGIIRQV